VKTNERRYFWLMGTCITLVALAWFVVRLWSVTAAIVMSAVAAVIPPTAVIIANRPWETRHDDDDR
jgi:hypothetical protein